MKEKCKSALMLLLLFENITNAAHISAHKYYIVSMPASRSRVERTYSLKMRRQDLFCSALIFQLHSFSDVNICACGRSHRSIRAYEHMSRLSIQLPNVEVNMLLLWTLCDKADDEYEYM